MIARVGKYGSFLVDKDKSLFVFDYDVKDYFKRSDKDFVCRAELWISLRPQPLSDYDEYALYVAYINYKRKRIAYNKSDIDWYPGKYDGLVTMYAFNNPIWRTYKSTDAYKYMIETIKAYNKKLGSAKRKQK